MKHPSSQHKISFYPNKETDQIFFRIDLGRTKYRPVWELQKKLVDLRAGDTIPNCLLITEHEPVITLGRGTNLKNLLTSPEQLDRMGIDLCNIERGGDVTFHGPGQIVMYPIVDLRDRGRDVRRFLRDMERFVIATLAELGFKAGTKEGLTGIWVGNHKLGAIGVAVSKWVTYHGVALNVDTDLDFFKLINPCGITKYPVGSITGMLGRKVTMNEIIELLVEAFERIFECQAQQVSDIATIVGE